jgi:hypothetical protein
MQAGQQNAFTMQGHCCMESSFGAFKAMLLPCLPAYLQVSN